MKKEDNIEEEKVRLLREIKSQFDTILNLLARNILDPEEVKKSITKGTTNPARIINCYNSCDGETILTDIAKNNKIDKSTISRHIDSWKREGFLFKIEKGGNVYPKSLIYLK